MNSHLQNYFHSFRLKSDFLYSFITDVVAVSLITILFVAFGKILESRAYAISGGKTLEELQTILLAGSEEINQAFLSNVQLFTYLLVIGSIVLLLLSLFIISYSRARLWHRLLHHPYRGVWRWNLMSLLLAFLFFIILFLYVLARMLLNSILPATSDTFYLMFMQVITALFLLFFFSVIFLAYYSFTAKNKVFESLGNAFHLMKTHWGRFWTMFALALLTGVALSFILYYIHKTFFLYQPELVRTIISSAVLLLFISWFRLYVLKTIHHETTASSPQ